jgi:hypothetical protein
MIRTMRHWLVGVAVAGGGVATAQPSTSPAALAAGVPSATRSTSADPAPARAQAPADAELLVMRTAGQPDRRIQVLKVSQYPDGQSVADLLDVESGQRFTVPGRMVAGLRRAAGAAPPTPAAAVPPPAPKPAAFAPPPIQPAAAVQAALPVAAPLVSSRPVTGPPTASRVELPVAKAAPPGAAAAPPVATSASAWRSIGDGLPRPAPAPPAPPAPPPAPAAAVKRDLWNAVGQPPVGPPPAAPAVPAGPHPVPSPTAPGFAPTLSPAAPPPPVEPVIRGQAPESTYGYRRLQFHPAAGSEPPVRGFPVRPADVPAPQPGVPRVQEERAPLGQASFAFPVRPPLEQQLQDDTKQAVFDLYMAVRPTVREEAASVLAGGRFASRPEVKQVLAKAALADPAACVRAHCIRLLDQLGYHDPEYVSHLREYSAGGPPAVQTAAAAALANLAPK